ncbi:MAG TPA: protein-disulfide isomerase [Idiomarina sp.]|nr:protein-disulfide isomerase [Idiomarina sp.]
MFKRMTLFIGAALMSNAISAQSLTDNQETDLAQIETMLRDNPQLIGNMRQGLENFLEEQKAQKATYQEYKDWLFDTSTHPTLGNIDAAHSIVIFTDYNCPYCKKLEPSLERLIKEYPSVNVINIIVPLRQRSVDGINTNATEFGLSVWSNASDSYYDVHTLLMSKSGMHNADSLRAIAERTETQAWLEHPQASKETIKKNLQTFQALGFRGTPTIMIGEQWIPGFIQYGQIEQIAKQEFGL